MHFFNNFQSTYLAAGHLQGPAGQSGLPQGAGARHRPRHAGPAGAERHLRRRLLDAAAWFPGLQSGAEGQPGVRPGSRPAALAASGIDPATVTLELYSNGRDVFMEFVKQQWETNLGITVNLNVLEGGVWGQQRADHAMQVYRGPYEYDYVDPSNMLTGLFRSQPAPEGKTEPWGSPRHTWKSEEFDKLVTDAGAEADVDDAHRDVSGGRTISPVGCRCRSSWRTRSCSRSGGRGWWVCPRQGRQCRLPLARHRSLPDVHPQ